MKLSDLNSYTKAEIRALSITRLARLIQKAKDYYTAGKSPISDNLYDDLEDILRRKDPSNAVLSSVGAKVKGRRKVKLPFPLYSLAKLKPTDGAKFDRWLAKHEGPYVVSDKEDGLSVMIQYIKGKPAKAFTRGDGSVGQDVSHLIPFFKIPKSIAKDNVTIRAEIAMTEAAFAKIRTKKDEDSRNVVAGLTNRLNSDASMLKNADILAYEVIEPRLKPSAAFKYLKAKGFKTAPHTLVGKGKLTLDVLEKLHTASKSSSKYTIDGIVIEQDSVNKRPPAGTHHPSYAFAFKMRDESSIKQVTVKSVEWEESKHGRLAPVIVIPKIRLGGVSVENATGHNAFFIANGYRFKDRNKGIKKRPIGKGAVIRVVRSGDVIPHVVEVVKGVTKPDFPKVKFAWDSNGVQIALTGTSDLVRDKRITSFFSTLGVDGIKLGVVQQLTEAGLTSIVKILRASVSDFLKVPGFKQRKAQNLFDSIRAKTRAVDLPTLMDGSGYFGLGFGTRRAALVVEAYPDLLTKWEKLTPSQITAKVASIHGFQTKTATQFGSNFHKFTKWLRVSKIKPVLPTKIKAVGSKLKGEAVCFTGFRDKAMEESIVKQGGTIVSGVSSKTTILVYADGKSSSKLDKAEALGIKTFTGTEFKRKYKL